MSIIAMTTNLDQQKLMTGFTEDDVRRTLRRALILAGALALIATPILWVWQGWQTWLMFLVGAVISATGIFEWMQMLSAMMSRMEEGRTPTPMGRVMVMFFLRLALAGLLLYASLNSLHGSIYALLAGLAVSLFALSVESIRLAMRT
jgi:Na+/H+-translocating membrane pyrophosphatase